MLITLNHFPSEISKLLVLPFSEMYNSNRTKKSSQNLIFSQKKICLSTVLLLAFHVIAFSYEKHHCPSFYVVVCKFLEKFLLFPVAVFSFLGGGRWASGFTLLKEFFIFWASIFVSGIVFVSEELCASLT